MADLRRTDRRKRKKSLLRRLLWANLIALLALITATVITLACLGLLGSIITFIF